MRIRKLVLVTIISAAIGVTGCHSSEQLINPELSLKRKNNTPQFIQDIELGGNTTNIKVSSIKVSSQPSSIVGSKKGINPSVSNVLQQKYSELLQVVPHAITNFPLYNFIEDWYGVRYRMGGNDRSGIDCSAFVQRLYENVFCTNLVRTAMEQFSTCRLFHSQDSLKEGDLVFFKTKGKKRITHVGIYLMNNYFVHASSSQGVVISSLNEAYWSRYYAGAGKVLYREENL